MEDLMNTLQGLTLHESLAGQGQGQRTQQLLPLKNGDKVEDLQNKFWNHRILFSIIESIVTSETQLPGLPPQALKYLENILRDVRLRKLGRQEIPNVEINGNGNPVTDTEYELPPTVKSLLSKYINIELKSLAQSVVKIYLEKLKSVHASEEDRQKLVQIMESQNPLQLIVQFAMERKEQEILKKTEIERLKEIRDKELFQYELDLTKLKDRISRFVGPEGLLQQSQPIDAAYIELLKVEGENLTAKTQMTRMSRLIEENPPELISEFQETLKEMEEIISELETEISDTNDLEIQFNSLKPDFQELLRERERVEEDIRNKEWALKSLEKYNNSDQ